MRWHVAQSLVAKTTEGLEMSEEVVATRSSERRAEQQAPGLECRAHMSGRPALSVLGQVVSVNPMECPAVRSSESVE